MLSLFSPPVSRPGELGATTISREKACRETELTKLTSRTHRDWVSSRTHLAPHLPRSADLIRRCEAGTRDRTVECIPLDQVLHCTAYPVCPEPLGLNP